MKPLAAGDPRQVGPYRLRARLGSGGMGQVFLGYSPGGRAVAVKVVHAELAHDSAFRVRFRREVAAARAVSGAYTAPVTAAGPDDDPPWLATAFVSGPSLADAVAAAGPLPAASVWKLAAGLVEALQAVHACGLVHRDLKPANVMLAIDGPRLIDFGISRALESTVMTSTGLIVGTPSFMSPEQAEGTRVRPASDVFSLGSVVVFAATGAGPFGDGPPATMLYRVVHAPPKLDEVPGGLRELAAACLAKAAIDRPALETLVDKIAAALAPGESTGPASFWPVAVTGLIRSYQARLGAEIPSLALGSEAQVAPEAQPVAPEAQPVVPEAQPVEPGVQPVVPEAQPVETAGWPEAQSVETVARPGASPRGTRPMTAPTQVAADAVPPARLRDPTHLPVPPSRASGSAGSGHRRHATQAPGPPGAPDSAGQRAVPALPGDLAGGAAPGPGRPAPAVTRRRAVVALLGVSAAAGAAAAGWELSHQPGRPAPHGSPGAPVTQPAVPQSGQSIWNVAVGGDVQSGIAAADGMVYVGSGNDNVYGLRASDGRQVWAYPTAGTVMSDIAVARGVVYAGSQDQNIYALHGRDGHRIWAYPTGNLVSAGLAVAGDTVYGAAIGVTALALRASDGRQIWDNTDGTTAQGIAVAGDAVYAGSIGDGNIYALRAGNGDVIWKFPTDGPVGSGIAVAGGAVYAGSEDHKVYALAVGHGDRIWDFTTGGSVESGIAVADGTVYVGSWDHNVYALQASDGRKLWAFPTGGLVTSGIAVARGVVYVGSFDANVYALQASDGRKLWAFATGGVVESGIVVAGRTVYAASGGTVYALGA